MFGLSPKTTWAQITSNEAVQVLLNQAYGGDVSKCDLYVCGLAEDHAFGANVGETFDKILRIQYDRLRIGDRFWYENPGVFTPTELIQIRQTNLADIILRNTNISSIQCFVMAAPDNCVKGVPTLTTTGVQTPTYGNTLFSLLVMLY